MRQCHDVQCILSDVREFDFPDVPLVIFMWHPFVGPVFEQVMTNLEESLQRNPREVYLVYLKPQYEHLVIERVPSLKKIWETHITMTEQDFAAYIFPDRSETCVAYATVRSHRTSPGVAQAGGDSVDGCGESAVDGV